MAMLIKTRARKPLERAPISSVGYAPHGVGGLGHSEPCLILQLGEHRLIVSMKEYAALQESVTRVLESSK